MVRNIVEGITFKLDNGNELVLKVALDNRLPQRLKSLSKFNDFYEDYIEVTLENSVDNVCVKHIDQVDIEQVKQVIKKHEEWDINDFDLDIMNDCDYLINDIITILCGNLFGRNNGNGMIITIPTTKYKYFEDKIYFEVRGLDGSISSMNIVEFMQLVSTFTSEPYTDPYDDYKAKYTFDSRYTYFTITKYETNTVLASYVGNV